MDTLIISKREFEHVADLLLIQEIEEYLSNYDISKITSKTLKDLRPDVNIYIKENSLEIPKKDVTGDFEKDLSSKIRTLLKELESGTPESIRKARVQLLSCDTKRWADKSINPVSKLDLLVRLILSKQYDGDLVCMAYITSCNIWDKEFLKTLIFCDSDLFDFDLWTDEYVDYVVNLCIKAENNKDKMPLELLEENLPSKDCFYYEKIVKFITKIRLELDSKRRFRLVTRIDWAGVKLLDYPNRELDEFTPFLRNARLVISNDEDIDL